MVASLVMSLTDLGSADLLDPLGVDVVGLDNYLRLFDDPKFLTPRPTPRSSWWWVCR